MVTTREKLLNVAARELAEHGYAGASLNRILSEAGVSKSSAYHHFSDKADLAVTVLERYWNVLEMEKQLARPTPTAEAFWLALREMHNRQLLMAKDEPWMWSTLRCGRDILVSVPESHPAAMRIAPMLSWLYQVIARGRKLGAIRRDLPDSLLISLMMALDHAADTWLADNGEKLSRAKLKTIGGALQTLMFALLAPKEMQHGQGIENTRRVAAPRRIARVSEARGRDKGRGGARRPERHGAKGRANTLDGAR